MRHRSDNSKAAIVKGLRKVPGITVEIIEEPCDIMVRKASWPGGLYQVQEIKTRTQSGKMPKNARQTSQEAYCAANGIPKVTSLAESLAALPLL
jgi:hypothetical protein